MAFALPPRCPGCGVVTPEDHRFCLDCWTKLIGGPACASCGEPFEYDSGPGARCRACLRELPAFDGVQAAVAYGEIASKIARRLKYGGRPGLAETAARQMARLIPDKTDLLVAPVPLHRWRIWRRGYNPSALIARALCTREGLTLALGLLERKRATPILRGLAPAACAKAVRGARLVEDRAQGARHIADRRYLHQGGTANACAKALKRAGAGKVWLLCWARVVREEAEPVDILPVR